MNKYYQQGYGGLGMFFFGAVIAVAMYFFIFPDKYRRTFQTEETGTSTYCRNMINDPNAPTITAPSYQGNQVDNSKQRQYRLIKKNVPIVSYVWNGAGLDVDYEHTIHAYRQSYTDPKTGEHFTLRIPHGASGRSYEFKSTVDPSLSYDLSFSEYGLLFAYHTDEKGEPIRLETFQDSGWGHPHMVDIYKAVDTDSLPDWVLQCIDGPSILPFGTEDVEFYYPDQKWSPMKAEEQLGWFLFRQDIYVYRSWWVPHCKPAIYLYPEQETKVNVKVNILQGSFLYTDPIYPSGGWNVLARPNGDIVYSGDLKDSKGIVNYPSGVFPYLYYEAKIHDSAIEKPTKGFMVAYDKLPLFYAEMLPKLGLNATETQQFKEYWEKSLPHSPFYFIGIVPQANLDEIEPLTITPKQDTTIRVSLYFEALDGFKIVTPPLIETPTRSGFTVVEWGGMIKTDKDHPFTCSQ